MAKARRLVICVKCGEEGPHQAKGMCSYCYKKDWAEANIKKVRASQKRYSESHKKQIPTPNEKHNKGIIDWKDPEQVRDYKRKWMNQWRANHLEEARKRQRQKRAANLEEARAYDRAYSKTHKEDTASHRMRVQKWRHEHPDLVKAQNARAKAKRKLDPSKVEADRRCVRSWYRRHVGYLRMRHHDYFILHREGMLAAAAERRNNPEKRLSDNARLRVRRKTPRGRMLRRASAARYARTHADILRVQTQRHRARKKVLPHTLTASQWKAIKAAYGYRCAYCGKKRKLTQDHVVPVSKGGGYVADNIVPACMSCNASKGNRPPPFIPPTRLML